MWDASFCYTWSQTGVVSLAVQPGSCRRKRKKEKWPKYLALTYWFQFQPVTVEASGVLGQYYIKFNEYVSSSMTLKPVIIWVTGSAYSIGRNVSKVYSMTASCSYYSH